MLRATTPINQWTCRIYIKAPPFLNTLNRRSDRATKFGKTRFAKGSFYLKLADKQGHLCPVCGESIYNGEPLHLHHKIPVHNGGDDSLNNLVWLHQACHHTIHSNKSKKEKLSSIARDWEVTEA